MMPRLFPPSIPRCYNEGGLDVSLLGNTNTDIIAILFRQGRLCETNHKSTAVSLSFSPSLCLHGKTDPSLLNQAWLVISQLYEEDFSRDYRDCETVVQ